VKRRGFMQALAALVLAPSLIEKLKVDRDAFTATMYFDHSFEAVPRVTTTSDLDRLMREVYSKPLSEDFYGVSGLAETSYMPRPSGRVWRS